MLINQRQEQYEQQKKKMRTTTLKTTSSIEKMSLHMRRILFVSIVFACLSLLSWLHARQQAIVVDNNTGNTKSNQPVVISSRSSSSTGITTTKNTLMGLLFPSQQITWIKIFSICTGTFLTFYCFFFMKKQPKTNNARSLHKPSHIHTKAKSQAVLLEEDARVLLEDSIGVEVEVEEGEKEKEEIEFPHLKLVDECDPLKREYPVNGDQPIEFENDFFKGNFCLFLRSNTSNNTSRWSNLFGTKRRMLWVQVQGEFKKQVDIQKEIYLAGELPKQPEEKMGFLTKKMAQVLVNVIQRFVPQVHISFGTANEELPHAAFPLYECVDEMVITNCSSSTPSLGVDTFGEPHDAKKKRMSSGSNSSFSNRQQVFQLGQVYTFQFHTMYVDMTDWKVKNLPGIPEVSLEKFFGTQPLQLAAYEVSPTTSSSTANNNNKSNTVLHTIDGKKYLFCFSVRYQNPEDLSTPTAIKTRIPTSAATLNQVVSPRSLHSTYSNKQLLKTSSKRNVKASHREFNLRMFIERIDPIAGNRKVSYLFEVMNQQNKRRRTVIRSALTLKKTLFSDLNDTRGVTSKKKFITESRAYLYDTIIKDTVEMNTTLQEIESKSSSGNLQYDQLQLCLDTSGTLHPMAITSQELGIHFSNTKRQRMDILMESHTFRHLVNPSTSPMGFLREEWVIVTTSEVRFYRTFSVQADKKINLADILSIEAVDNTDLLNDEEIDEEEESYSGKKQLLFSPSMSVLTPKASFNSSSKTKSTQRRHRRTNRWNCIQLILLDERVYFFVENPSKRQQMINLINQMIKLKSRTVSLEDSCSTTTSTSTTSSIPSRLLTTTTTTRVLLDAKTRIVLNKQPSFILLEQDKKVDINPQEIVQTLVEQANEMYRMTFGYDMTNQDTKTLLQHKQSLANFLNAVEKLRQIQVANLPEEHTEKLCFYMNLYHILYVHAHILYGRPLNHEHWAKIRAIPCYVLGNDTTMTVGNSTREIQLSLFDIEMCILRARMPPTHSNTRTSRFFPEKLLLDHPDFRISFALAMNIQCPTLIPCYEPSKIHFQLNQAVAEYLAKELIIRKEDKIIYLPKICEWFREDYISNRHCIYDTTTITTTRGSCSTPNDLYLCLQKLLGFIPERNQQEIHELLLQGCPTSSMTTSYYQLKYNKFWTQSDHVDATSSTTSSSSSFDTMFQALLS